MTNWIGAAVHVLGCVGSFVAGYFGGRLGSEEASSQVGVQSLDLNHPVFEIINSTNVKLNTLADQHAEHKENVQQLLFLGFGAIFLLALVLVIALVVAVCVWCRSNTQQANKSPFAARPDRQV